MANSKISGGRNYAENSTDRKWMGEKVLKPQTLG